MPSLWIRVDADIADSAKVRRFAHSIGASAESAVGLLVFLWGKVADKRDSGDISDVPDDLLEEWARWRGERGVFAKHFREHFASDGQINDWTDHQGKLIERRKKERARWLRRNSTGGSAESPPEAPMASAAANGNGNGTTTTTTTARAMESAVGSAGHLALAGRMTDERYRTALEGYLRAAHDPPRLLSEFESIASGVSGPGGRQVTPDLLGQALHEMAIAGAKCTSRILAAFVRREMMPDSEPKHGNGKPREATKVAATEAAGDAWSRRRQHA